MHAPIFLFVLMQKCGAYVSVCTTVGYRAPNIYTIHDEIQTEIISFFNPYMKIFAK